MLVGNSVANRRHLFGPSYNTHNPGLIIIECICAVPLNTTLCVLLGEACNTYASVHILSGSSSNYYLASTYVSSSLMCRWVGIRTHTAQHSSHLSTLVAFTDFTLPPGDPCSQRYYNRRLLYIEALNVIPSTAVKHYFRPV